MHRVESGLFRHHVGTTAPAARWYLAAMGALSLLLISTHFSIQLRVQQEATQMVETWIERVGGSVESTRFHLLNGQLSLQNVQLQQAGLGVQVPKIQIRTSLQHLTRTQPEFRDIALLDVRLLVPAGTWQSMLKTHQFADIIQLFQTFNLANTVRIQHGQFRVEGEMNSPPNFEDISIELTGPMERREIRASAKIGEGLIHYQRHWQQKEGVSPVAHSELIAEHTETVVFTQHIPGIEDVPGLWSGKLTWQESEAEATPKLTYSGKIAWDDPSTITPRLIFSGEITGYHWLMQAEATDFPVQAISAIAPAMHGRHLTAGFYSGVLEITGKNGLSKWEADFSGSLLHARYQTPAGAPALPDWSAAKVEIDGAHLEAPARKISAKRIVIEDASMGFSNDATALGDKAHWRMDVPNLRFGNLRFSLWHDQTEMLQLPPLRGTLTITSDGFAKLSAAQQESDTTLRRKESWHISGDKIPIFSTNKELELSIHASKAPLHRFRHLLPNAILPGGAHPELEGDCDLAITLRRRQQSLLWSGAAKAQNVYVAAAGDSWRAENIELDIQQGSLDHMRQHIRQLIVEHWHYQSALRPLHLRDPATAETVGPSASKPATAAIARTHSTTWQLDTLKLADGSFSVGRPSSVWAHGIELVADGLQSGKSARFEVKATVSGGAASLAGNIDPFSSVPYIDVKGELWNALPFFLRDWLSVSGAPIMTRGRVSMKMALKNIGESGYDGSVDIRFRHASAHPGAYPNDPLLKTAGYSTHSVFKRLGDASESISLHIPITGDWRQAPITWPKIGNAFVDSIKQAMQHTKPEIAKEPKTIAVANVRLHETKPLSLNERKRLQQLVDQVRSNKRYYVELVPLLGNRELDDGLIERVRYTQNLIDSFMSYRGVSHSRLFPVWPHDIHREGDNSGIRIMIYSR